MSKTVQSETKETSQDAQNLNRFFEEIEKSIKQYHVVATTLQSECTQSCKKTFETQMAALQEFFTKSGFDKKSSDTVQKATNQYFDSMASVIAVQNQVLTNMMESCRQNVKMCSENWSKFTAQNSKIMQSWNLEDKS